MDIEIEVEIFDPSSKTTLTMEDSVNIRELIEYIQQQYQEQFNGVDRNSIQILIGGTQQVIQPSDKTLKDVLKNQRKAKFILKKGTPQDYQSSSQSFNRSSFQMIGQQQQQNNQFVQNQQSMYNQNNNNVQQSQQNQQGQQIDVKIKTLQNQFTQVLLDDSLQLKDLFQFFQEDMKQNLQQINVYFGQVNLSLENQNQTLKQLGMKNQAFLEFKQNIQRTQQAISPQMITNNQNIVNPTMMTNAQNNQQNNQQFGYQNPQTIYQQPIQQQVNQVMQSRQIPPPQQGGLQYGQQPNNNLNQQQIPNFNATSKQQSNPGNYAPQPQMGTGKQITINFEILDGSIKRQFSTITNTANTLGEILDAVYQYLGISKDVASVDLYVHGSPFGGNKLNQSLHLLQMTQDNMTLQVKLRWIGG